MSDTSASPEYKSFRSSIQQKKIVVDKNSSKEWIVYDAGPKDVRCPLICLPPVSGTADVFFKQMLTLSTLGYRTIAVSYPVYWTLEEFYIGFRRLIDHLGLDKVHLFGASLGGFLAQKFAEHVADCMIVHSLVLCNAFCDTSVFHYTDAAAMFWMMPSFVLKRLVMGSFPNREVDPEIADSLDFMVEKLDSLGQQELASRLTLNCSNSFVNPEPISHLDVTLLDVFDECAISLTVKDSMYKLYPNAKMAHMKSGGNFPYLSRSAEVNVHLQVHLRKYIGTKYSACEAPSPSTKPTSLEFLQAAQCSGDSTDTVEALNTIDSRGDRLPSFTDVGASSPKLTASKHIPSDDEEDENMFGGGSVTDSTKPCVSDDENIFGVSENIVGTKSFVLEEDDEIIFGGSTADSTKPCVSDDENMFGEPVTDNNSKWENFDDRFLVDRDDFPSSKLALFQEESSAYQSALDNEKSLLPEENDIIFGGSELENSKLVMDSPGKSSNS